MLNFSKQFLLKNKFLCYITIIILMFIIIIGITLYDRQKLINANEHQDKYIGLSIDISELYSNALQTEQAVRNIYLNPTDEKAKSNYKNAVTGYNEFFAKIENFSKENKVLQLEVQQIKNSHQKTNKIKDQILVSINENNLEQARQLFIEQSTKSWREEKEILLQTKKLIFDINKNADDAVNTTIDLTVNTIIISLCILISFMIMTVYLFYKLVSESYNSIIERLKDLNSGEADLTKRFDEIGKDETFIISNQFNIFISKLQDIIINLSNQVNNINNESLLVVQSTEQISTATEETVAQTATVATAVEEMAATSHDISASCIRVADFSKISEDITKEGITQVQQTINNTDNIIFKVNEIYNIVNSLNISSDEISKVIETIEEVADSTQLLSLNASIESARLGDAGASFGVIAQEVKNLSQKTMSSTVEITKTIKKLQDEISEITKIISNTVDEANESKEINSKSAEALRKILEQIEDISIQINQIATAAEEQSSVNNDISSNILQIQDCIQSIANLTAESVISTRKVNNVSDEINNIVTQFTIK